MLWLIFGLGFVKSAGAVVSCVSNGSVLAGPRAVSEYFLRTNVYGPADRKTAKDFAKDNGATPDEIAKRYAASGDLQCGNAGSQAQLVVRNDVILASNHSLPGSPCVDPKALANCKVTFKQGDKPITYSIKKLRSTGYRCKKGWSNEPNEDWAILELDKAVVSTIKPYKVKNAPCASDENPVDVVAVGKSIDVGPAPRLGWTHWMKHFANCQLRHGNCGQRFPAMESDCDASHGTSGGGMFLGGADPHLVAILQNGNEGCGNSNPDGKGAYKKGCWSSIYAPIAGELSSELERLDGIGSSESDRSPEKQIRRKTPNLEEQTL